MEGTLLTNEIELLEISVDNDTLRITNKRLILNNKFIGINELRGANVTVTPVTIGAGETQNYHNTRAWTIIFFSIIIYIPMCISLHPYNFQTYFGYLIGSIMIGALIGFILAAPIHLILKAKNAISSNTVDMAWLVVEKTDNTYFINQYYSLGQLEQLKKFENEINTLIFK